MLTCGTSPPGAPVLSFVKGRIDIPAWGCCRDRKCSHTPGPATADTGDHRLREGLLNPHREAGVSGRNPGRERHSGVLEVGGHVSAVSEGAHPSTTFPEARVSDPGPTGPPRAQTLPVCLPLEAPERER